MAYKYDVFLSYKRKTFLGEWVHNEFCRFFQVYLEEALGYDVDIFIDTEEIINGEAWKRKIESALIHSKVMVSICSSNYFNSEWCIKEFAFMDYRQIKHGYMT